MKLFSISFELTHELQEILIKNGALMYAFRVTPQLLVCGQAKKKKGVVPC